MCGVVSGVVFVVMWHAENLLCGHSKRPRMCVQHVPPCTGNIPTCNKTCAHVARAHGNVFNTQGTF